MGAELGGQAIGTAGELFVQYKLIKRGIDSARLTTDSGIDLVMYIPGTIEAHTIQVKSIIRPFADGGTGPLVTGWMFPRGCKAEWLAGVDISRDRVWLFPIQEALQHARGNTKDVMLYWRLEEPRGTKVGIGLSPLGWWEFGDGAEVGGDVQAVSVPVLGWAIA